MKIARHRGMKRAIVAVAPSAHRQRAPWRSYSQQSTPRRRVRRALGVGRSVERDFWHPRATALVRNPASLSDEQRDFHSPSRELCTRCERPRSRAAEQRDELASVHSITSSASASNLSGISTPSAFAVAKLMRARREPLGGSGRFTESARRRIRLGPIIYRDARHVPSGRGFYLRSIFELDLLKK
jgi:hypothetical protein